MLIVAFRLHNKAGHALVPPLLTCIRYASIQINEAEKEHLVIAYYAT